MGASFRQDMGRIFILFVGVVIGVCWGGLENYTAHSGYNVRCGPHPGIADNITVIRFEDCIDNCDATEACAAVVTNANANTRCYFKAEESFGNCENQFGYENGLQLDDVYDLYIKVPFQTRIFAELAAQKSEERRQYLLQTLGPADSNAALLAPVSG